MSGDGANIILPLVNLYGFTVDTQRWNLFDDIFTDDVQVDYGDGSVWSDLASLKSDFATFHAPFDATQHIMSNTIWRFEGRSAKAVTYGQWTLIRYGAPGGDIWRSQGWYEDEFVHLPVGWRISRRICRSIWAEGNPGVKQTGMGTTAKVRKTTSLRQEADDGKIGILAGKA